MRKLWAGFLLLFISACASSQSGAPSQENAAILPAPPNYRAIIVQEMRKALKDPYSVRSAEITAPAPGFVGVFNGGTRTVICIRYNAKNSYGAYIGIREGLFFVTERGLVGPGENMFAGCADRRYQPFPELEATT